MNEPQFLIDILLMYWIETVTRIKKKPHKLLRITGVNFLTRYLCKFIKDDRICVDGKREITRQNLFV